MTEAGHGGRNRADAQGLVARQLAARQAIPSATCGVDPGALYAGVWGYSAALRGLLGPGDLEEALMAAAAIGDDRIQRAAGGRIDQDT